MRITVNIKAAPKPKKLISIPQLKKKVQNAVNKYVRERDKDLPCISCGKWADTWHAGHYWPQGSNGGLRYNLDNLHKQCVSCNLFKHGNQGEYRFGLIAKIGEKRVRWLEDHRHELKKWKRDELEEIINSTSEPL